MTSWIALCIVSEDEDIVAWFEGLHILKAAQPLANKVTAVVGLAYLQYRLIHLIEATKLLSKKWVTCAKYKSHELYK